MRFSALLRKELRESLPWMILTAIIFVAISGLQLRAWATFTNLNFYNSHFTPGSSIQPHLFTRYSLLQIIGPLLLISSIGLGLILSVRHFWIPHFTKTWPFLLHRSVSRKKILGAKLTAAIVAFALSLGLLWTALYWHICRSDLFLVSPPGRIFIEGWLFIALGLVAYLGAALVDLSTAKWYTTKIFGLAFAAILTCMLFLQWRLNLAFAVVIIGVAVLLSQIIDTFLNREF